jgi:hypothetical protein
MNVDDPGVTAYSVRRTKSVTPGRNTQKVLLLDFDGCGHPDEICLLSHHTGLPEAVLPVEKEHLFMYVGVLDVLLQGTETWIVLSTIWVAAFGFEFSKSQLSPVLQAHVIGSTFVHSTLSSKKFVRGLTRYEQISLAILSLNLQPEHLVRRRRRCKRLAGWLGQQHRRLPFALRAI